MPSLLERLPSGSRIAVIRLRSLGDCVLTTPALALLKDYRPDLRVAVVAEDRFRSIFEGNPDVDEILSPSVGEVRKWRSRLALNLHGGTRSMILTVASGAGIRAGFEHHRHSFLYSAKIPRAQEILGEERPVHTAEHIASAMFWLGAPPSRIPRAKLVAGPSVARGAQDGAASAPLAQAQHGHGSAAGTTSNTAVVHPFASEQEKTWPSARFVEVATYLRDSGQEPVFVAGPDDDVSAFQNFKILRGAPLSEVKSQMAQARIFIGNDSGPAHIAAAFGVPVVAIFGASNPVTWAPWRTEARVLTSLDGIGGIETSEVIAAVESLKKVRA